MVARFTSAVRPERISSPMRRTAAVGDGAFGMESWLMFRFGRIVSKRNASYSNECHGPRKRATQLNPAQRCLDAPVFLGLMTGQPLSIWVARLRGP